LLLWFSARLALLFLSSSYLDLLPLPSFPTRRSSDLHYLEFLDDYSRNKSVGINYPPFLGLRLVHLLCLLSHLQHPLWFSRIQRRSEEHTSELQSRFDLVCRRLLDRLQRLLRDLPLCT